ncbi:hypothetical protein LJC19_00125 [Oxalobacter sp. OttesenSCG-928-P03]|nr:hypothetical protein [Oxalobacter sp. OttesenSCG-928-P03]
MPHSFRAFFFAIAALFFSICAPSAFAAGYDKLQEPYPGLMAEAEEMATLDAIMPVRIFNLASRFAEAPDPELTAKLVDKELTRSTDKRGFVRRVGYTALRFMKRKDFKGTNVSQVIMRGLDDPVEWVRYDAVWAGEAVGLDTPAFRKKLAEMAKGLDPSEYESIPASDAKKQRQRRAGRLLKKLETGKKK